MIKTTILIAMFTLFLTVAKGQENQIKFDNGVSVNILGFMTSTNIRYKTISIDYKENTQLMFGTSFSYFIGKNNPNEYQIGGSAGVFLNDEVSLEIEGNYIVNEDNLNGMYYNVGFRFYTPYNVVYDIKLGTKLIQLGVAYSLNFNLKK